MANREGRSERRVLRVNWTCSMEEELIQLWQQHECLYDVSSNAYHNRTDKEKSWAAIAEALNQTVQEVKKRTASLRTQYSRLLKPKPSGSGDTTQTPKQTWILHNLEFLRSHVTPRQTETSLDPSIRAQLEDGDENDPDDQLSDPDEDLFEPPEPVGMSQPSTSGNKSNPSTTQQRPPKKRQKENDIELQKLAVLKQCEKRLSAAVAGAKPPTDTELFGQQVTEELKNIKDLGLKTRVKRKIMNIIYEAQESEQSSLSLFPTYPQMASSSHSPYPYPPPPQSPAPFTSQQPTPAHSPPLQQHYPPPEHGQLQRASQGLTGWLNE